MIQSPIFVKTQDFLIWILQRTERFPRSQRFVMARRVQDTILDFQSCLVFAAKRRDPMAKLNEADAQRHSECVLQRAKIFSSCYIVRKSYKNALKHALTGLNALKHALTGLNALKHALTGLNALKHALTGLNALKCALTGLNALKHALTELNVLKHALTELNVLKHALTHLTIQHWKFNV
ncbi:four helix bundle protein [bacterium]|nr:four helix bundle protein [bacterium]